jgi:CHAT domain-containing protein/tetratricopeptide (TPR) repeat protein
MADSKRGTALRSSLDATRVFPGDASNDERRMSHGRYPTALCTRRFRRFAGVIVVMLFAKGVAFAQPQSERVDSQTTSLRLRSDSLRTLAYQQIAGGDAARALGNFQSELKLRTSVGDQSGEATALSNIGFTFARLGRRDSAIVSYRSALRVQRLLRNSAHEAVTMNNLGTVFEMLGERDSAEKYFRTVLPVFRASGNRAGEAGALNNLGALFDNSGRRDSALLYFRLAVPILVTLGDRAGEAKTFGNLGILHLGVGNLDSAMASLRISLQLAHAERIRDVEALALNNIGALFDEISQSDSAVAYYHAALPLQRDIGDSPGEATTLNNLGTVFARLGQQDSAVAYFRFAIAKFRAAGNRTGEARALANLGDAFSHIGQLDSVATSYNESLILARTVRDHVGEAMALNSLGVLLRRQGQRDSSIKYLRAAARLQRGGNARRDESRTLWNLGIVYAEVGQRDSALSVFRRAAWILTAVATTAPGDFLRQVAVEDAGGRIASAWARSALSSSPPSSKIPSSRADTLEAWGALERGRGQALRALRRGGALLEDSTVVERVAASTAAMVTRVARPGRAFVTFDSYDDTLLVLAVSPIGELRASRVPLPTDSLRRMIARVRALAGARGVQRSAQGTALPVSVARTARDDDFEIVPERSDSLASRWLAQTVLPAVIREALRGATELVIVPNGSLSLVPWSALPSDSSDTPFGATLAIRLVPSLTMLDELAPRAAARPRPTRAALGAQALIVGDPAITETAAALPGARAEATWLADTLLANHGATLLTDRAATVRAVRARLGAAPLIHFATHAAAYPEANRARGSYLQFAAVDSGAPSVLTVGELLDAAETDRLTLQARLVVLSACETGTGAASATEGVLGLQRAFLALGVETLLVSLWKVDDEATRALMGAFYRHWLDDADGPSAAESLRRAQSDMRLGKVPNWQPVWAKPNAWAAFQVVGAG